MMSIESLKAAVKRLIPGRASSAPPEMEDQPGMESPPGDDAGAPADAAPETSATETPAGDEVVVRHIDRGALSVDGRPVAVGLRWIGESSGATLKDKADMAAEQELAESGFGVSFDLYSEMKGRDFVAFGSRELGQTNRMPPLIDMFDDGEMGAKWLVVLPVSGADDMFWVGSMRDGGVFEDTLATSRTAASGIFLEYAHGAEWDTIIAPEGWSEEVPLRPLTRALLVKKPRSRLRYVSPLKVHATKLIAGGLLVLATSGGVWYAMDQNARHQAEMRELQERIQRAVSLSPADHPWYNRTLLSDFMQSCMEEIDRNIHAVPGWELQPFTCRADRGRAMLDMGWRRAANGNIAWLMAAMPEGAPALAMNEQMETATLSIPFSMPTDPDALTEEPWTQPVIEHRMRQRFQMADIPYTLRYVPDRRDPSVNAIFHRHDLQVTGDMDPRDFASLLEDIPAIVPEALSYNVATTGWTLILRIQHPVILPEIDQ